MTTKTRSTRKTYNVTIQFHDGRIWNGKFRQTHGRSLCSATGRLLQQNAIHSAVITSRAPRSAENLLFVANTDGNPVVTVRPPHGADY